jgi:hypothetical protein
MMKVEIRKVEQEKKVFEPIQLVLTIESVDELYSLYHRMFIGTSQLKDVSQVVGYPLPLLEFDNILSDKIFFQVSNHLNQLRDDNVIE